MDQRNVHSLAMLYSARDSAEVRPIAARALIRFASRNRSWPSVP